MRIAQLVMHRDGDSLVVTDEPLRRVVLEELLRHLCDALHHFLCGGASWPYRVGIGRWDTFDQQPYNLGNQLFLFGQWWGRKFDDRHLIVLTLPLTAEQARTLGAEDWQGDD